ncbi:DUF6011 domain-containing protein [[Mycobacterium] kokjensenii]|uniref:DUF6011 domain-containing protein n=1 Tax=[Mycobacterium] kokjensenii TaxID=3064287 RepID=UPI00359FD80D
MEAPAPPLRPAATTSPMHPDSTVSGPAVRAAIELLTSVGFGLSMPCQCCGHPLSTPESLLSGTGPKCRRRAKAVTP